MAESKIPENPPAFAGTCEHPGVFGGTHQHGMTLRDYFAAHVAPAYVREFFGSKDPEADIWADYTELAASIYAIADAMLAARTEGDK